MVRLFAVGAAIASILLGSAVAGHFNRHSRPVQLPTDRRTLAVVAIQFSSPDHRVESWAPLAKTARSMLWQQGWSADRLFILCYRSFLLSLAATVFSRPLRCEAAPTLDSMAATLKPSG
jgi:hypothetical protein